MKKNEEILINLTEALGHREKREEFNHGGTRRGCLQSFSSLKGRENSRRKGFALQPYGFFVFLYEF